MRRFAKIWSVHALIIVYLGVVLIRSTRDVTDESGCPPYSSITLTFFILLRLFFRRLLSTLGNHWIWAPQTESPTSFEHYPSAFNTCLESKRQPKSQIHTAVTDIRKPRSSPRLKALSPIHIVTLLSEYSVVQDSRGRGPKMTGLILLWYSFAVHPHCHKSSYCVPGPTGRCWRPTWVFLYGSEILRLGYRHLWLPSSHILYCVPEPGTSFLESGNFVVPLIDRFLLAEAWRRRMYTIWSSL